MYFRMKMRLNVYSHDLLFCICKFVNKMTSITNAECNVWMYIACNCEVLFSTTSVDFLPLFLSHYSVKFKCSPTHHSARLPLPVPEKWFILAYYCLPHTLSLLHCTHDGRKNNSWVIELKMVVMNLCSFSFHFYFSKRHIKLQCVAQLYIYLSPHFSFAQ